MAKSAWGWHSSGARRQPSEMRPWNLTEGVDGISNPGVFPVKKRWLSRGWTTTSLHCLSRPRKLVDICHLRQTWFRWRRFSHVGNSTVVFWELLLRPHTVQGCFASVNWQSCTAATCVTLEMHGGSSRHSMPNLIWLNPGREQPTFQGQLVKLQDIGPLVKDLACSYRLWRPLDLFITCVWRCLRRRLRRAILLSCFYTSKPRSSKSSAALTGSAGVCKE